MAVRRDGRPGDVRDVDVVARLRAVAVDVRLVAAEERAEEDRNDAGLAVGILAWPVDVPEAERDVLRLVQAVVRAQILLAGELRGAVRGERVQRGGLPGRPVVALAVDRAACRAEDDLRVVPASGLEHANRPEDVRVGVVVRALDRDAHVHLRREVEHGLGSVLVEDVVQRLPDVPLRESRGGGDVLPLAGRQRVDDDDLVPAGHERVGDVRADEAGAACDDGPHALHPTAGSFSGRVAPVGHSWRLAAA